MKNVSEYKYLMAPESVIGGKITPDNVDNASKKSIMKTSTRKIASVIAAAATDDGRYGNGGGRIMR